MTQVTENVVGRGLDRMLKRTPVEKETKASEKKESKAHEMTESAEYEKKEHKKINK